MAALRGASASHPLAGAFEKIKRANAHLERLKASVQDFIRRDEHSIVVEKYRHTVQWRRYSQQELARLGLDRYRIVHPPRGRGRSSHAERWRQGVDTSLFPGRTEYYVVRLRRSEPVPATEWGVTAGEVLNNLRGALDNLVWALTVKHQARLGVNVPPNPLPLGPRRRVMFPIVPTADAWTGGHGYPGLPEEKRPWGIDPRLKTRFKRLQPFYRRKAQAAARHWLWVLNELRNIDKHRAVPVLRHLIRPEGITITTRVTNLKAAASLASDVTQKTFKLRGGGPLEGEAEVARFKVVFARMRPEISAPNRGR